MQLGENVVFTQQSGNGSFNKNSTVTRPGTIIYTNGTR